MNRQQKANRDFAGWFRNSAPYINAFRGRVFVICFGGELLHDTRFSTLVEDIALLNSLGIRLVLVHGVRPQIEHCLKQRGLETRYVNGIRITDDAALQCVQQATGAARMEIEALLSMGLPNTPMAGAAMRVVSGNFITARPLGIVDGIDFQHTGSIRRIDHDAIRQIIDHGAIALLSPVGYSPTGEFFNLSAR
ncbi:MAG: amino-acid N-acetyltransferase, partial [Gammaproteobacteria bacterium]